MSLVLKRKINETVIINDRIRITVVDAGYGWVRLAFDAPRSVDIARAEVWQEPIGFRDDEGGEGGGHR